MDEEEKGPQGTENEKAGDSDNRCGTRLIYVYAPHCAVSGSLSGGVLTRVKSDLTIQQVQVKGLAGEQLQDAELFQHFGFTSCPPAGTQCIVLPIGGQTSHAIIIATENGAYRLQVASGEVASTLMKVLLCISKRAESSKWIVMSTLLKPKNTLLKLRIMALRRQPVRPLRRHY
ncbi:Mu-like prophage protein gp45 [Klebsiella pneumoniae]|nr:Mu-like prophage protein gp45 [Klebsiella pneumoniae]